MRNKKLVAYTLGEKITQLRKNMNLTQQEVANRLHLERSTYAHYEIEKTTPSAINLLSIARLFNVTVELLIDDKLAIPVLYTPSCMFCGGIQNTKQFGERFICLSCANKIKDRFE